MFELLFVYQKNYHKVFNWIVLQESVTDLTCALRICPEVGVFSEPGFVSDVFFSIFPRDFKPKNSIFLQVSWANTRYSELSLTRLSSKSRNEIVLKHKNMTKKRSSFQTNTFSLLVVSPHFSGINPICVLHLLFVQIAPPASNCFQYEFQFFPVQMNKPLQDQQIRDRLVVVQGELQRFEYLVHGHTLIWLEMLSSHDPVGFKQISRVMGGSNNSLGVLGLFLKSFGLRIEWVQQVLFCKNFGLWIATQLVHEPWGTRPGHNWLKVVGPPSSSLRYVLHSY